MASGSPAGSDPLILKMYDQLRALAARLMQRERADHTLQPTALANEAIVRLAESPPPPEAGRAVFLRLAARAMQNVLTDHARRRGRKKRGGAARRLSLDDVQPSAPEDSDEILAVDEALRRLEEEDPESAELVRLRFFGGLSVAEAAEAMGMSERSAARQWTYARAWLFRAINGDGQ